MPKMAAKKQTPTTTDQVLSHPLTRMLIGMLADPLLLAGRGVDNLGRGAASMFGG